MGGQRTEGKYDSQLGSLELLCCRENPEILKII